MQREWGNSGLYGRGGGAHRAPHRIGYSLRLMHRDVYPWRQEGKPADAGLGMPVPPFGGSPAFFALPCHGLPRTPLHQQL